MTDNSNSNSTQANARASEQIDRIVGVFANAVRQTVRESLLGSAEEGQTEGHKTLAQPRAQPQHSLTPNVTNSRRSLDITANNEEATASNPLTPFQRALQLQASMRRGGASSISISRPALPSVFRPAKRGKRCSTNNTPVASRPSIYVRDIMCLPNEFKRDDGTIHIPRGNNRSKLGDAGLIGKIEFTSAMSAAEIKMEICHIFMHPMGLSEDDLAAGNFFTFNYLQKTGAGSRSLCIPAVSLNFQWNGRQVASLSKSGGCMYIIVENKLPGLTVPDSPEKV